MWQFYQFLQEFPIYKSVTFGKCVGSATERRFVASFGNKFRRTFSDDRSGAYVRFSINLYTCN